MAHKGSTWTGRLVLFGFILILACLESAESSSPSLLESLGLPSNTEYEIVAPYEVDRHGRYVSHAVAHHHRRKRSLEDHGIDLASPAHFLLRGLGQNFHMELHPSISLVAPGFTIQTLGENGTEKLETFPGEDFCFYQGSLKSKVNSTVALSTCAGMSGLIRTQEADYFLKPLLLHQVQNENYTTAPEHHPHILYKIHTHAPEHSGGAKRRHRRHGHHDDYRHGAHQKQHYCGRRKKYMPQPPAEDVYISPDEYKSALRGRRAATLSTNPRLNVEMLVVVDPKMMENHGRENVTIFVLTVLNMVSTLFKDKTIGGDINVVIVGLILLSGEQDGLVINHHADHTLSSFCQWQSALAGREGRRHDHAILLTGLDICSWKNEPCDTLGFAPISGMCSKYRSCTINEDTGLGLAFTIAHESGHNFGMVHDGEGNVCKKSIGNIMSPTLAGDNGLFSWSSCSRQYLTRFLSTAQATCLSDEPKAMEEYKYPEKLPGELYDTDTQCKWQFGVKAKLCTLNFKKDICKALWCHRTGRKCETKFMPAAEGSSCGPDLWCRRGECVKQGDGGPQPGYGHWSGWSDWSSCSRTCESGVMYRERQCNHHEHVDGGSMCEGVSRVYKLCNTFDCPASAVDFRAAQCAEFNTKPFRGLYYRWKPYTQFKDHDACKLYCFAEGYDFFFALSNKVHDGTRCTLDSNSVCIDGVCERVGCDQELGSTAVLDMCGVCNGKNSTCKLYKGRYTKQHYSNQYYGVVTIPPGARSIHVVESNSSRSFLALRNTHRKYYLNGHWKVDWPGHYSIAGSVFDYKRPYNGLESLTSTGPTSETLVVEILLQGSNPGVQWEYTVTKVKTEKVTKPKHKYTWAVIRSECSATCAGGEMKTKAACYKDQRVQVNTSYCNPKSRPKTGTISCNTQPCPPRWNVGDWCVCSRTCGSGEQSRQVQCVQTASHTRVKVLSDQKCVQPPPARTRTCNTHSCPPTWSVGNWTQCSRKCGKGVQRRAVVCMRRNLGSRDLVLPDSECVFLPKPQSLENCVLKPCPRTHTTHWSFTHWQQCSVTCGAGVQFRSLQCVEKDIMGKHRTLTEKKCQHTPKPSAELQRVCVQPDCIKSHHSNTPQWYTSAWSQCTVSCGGGVQLRSVQCLLHRRPLSTCSLHLKPAASQICNTKFCPQQHRDTVCKDLYSWCHLVPQRGVCNHHQYRMQCCLSCSNTNF
ncbi:A disintegrin and metalloproteinase with thrombospondin motifs 16 isoform X2 [Pangasianodon hypophthalmus]|uniref:A disintegrin and metalloproteinase with thrombospondin motifs 16 isoform X2 n=1 Tax=Pangasianodon hypophthalmus TaxID=310915 RepID=UPI0023079D79|nr:A disintegrin and metalloproteinase with thrombospondin motifs 16 isoform X2 [Pangasianodon hypophthalmus]